MTVRWIDAEFCKRLAPFASCIVAVMLLAGCTPPRYDPLTGVVKKEGVSYRAAAPGPGWRLVQATGDSAFFNDATLAAIAANASCTEKGDPPLRVLLNHLLFGFTDKKIVAEETVTLDGREALKASFAARLDGVPRRFLVYVLKKDGCVFDLQYHAPEAAYESGIPTFETFVKGFGTIR